jgi:hypothetical protein
MFREGIVHSGQEAGVCFSGVVFSGWEKGLGEFQSEYGEEFGLGIGREKYMWDAGEVYELRAGRGKKKQGCERRDLCHVSWRRIW